MKIKKYIQFGIKWKPIGAIKNIVTTYVLQVPKGVTPSYYLWVSTGGKLGYRNNCFVNKLKNRKNFIFKQ
jgi:hypothetical protein